MSSFLFAGAETATKQLFIRMNGTIGEKLPPKDILKMFFSKFGKIMKITYAKNNSIAFITFFTCDEAKSAIDKMNGQKVICESNGIDLERTLFVDFAREKTTLEQVPKLDYVPIPDPVQKPVLPQKPILDVESANLPLVYLFPDQRPKMMSNQAMALLFELGLSPKEKFQGDATVQIFGNGIQWVIPHPDHPYSTQDCQKAYESGHYYIQLPIKIPRDVLTSKKFWRD
jgi:hypothetical protein